jgi:hypothetical protein
MDAIAQSEPAVAKSRDMSICLPPPRKYVRSERTQITLSEILERKQLHVESILSFKRFAGNEIVQYESAKWVHQSASIILGGRHNDNPAGSLIANTVSDKE